MSNNKQSSIEWFAKESWKLRVELEDGKISLGEYANKYYQLKEQAKAMHEEEVTSFTADWSIQYKYENGKNINQFYYETFGGNK